MGRAKSIGLNAPSVVVNQAVATQLRELEDIAAKHAAAVLDNARLYNEVQDLRGAIRVFCRVRPAGATGDGSPPCVEVGVDGQVRAGLRGVR